MGRPSLDGSGSATFQAGTRMRYACATASSRDTKLFEDEDDSPLPHPFSIFYLPSSIFVPGTPALQVTGSISQAPCPMASTIRSTFTCSATMSRMREIFSESEGRVLTMRLFTLEATS